MRSIYRKDPPQLRAAIALIAQGGFIIVKNNKSGAIVVKFYDKNNNLVKGMAESMLERLWRIGKIVVSERDHWNQPVKYVHHSAHIRY